MTDDIVTRLREQSDKMVMLHGSPDAPDEMLFANTFWFVCQDAADEIERLRTELATSKRECRMADDAVQDLQARLIEAVRGD